MPGSRRSLSLRVGLGAAFTTAALLTSSLFGAATFVRVRSFIRVGIRDRIGRPAPVMAARSHRFVETPTANGWNGVLVLDDK